MFKRLGIMCINIIFPPLGVMLLCGPETDMIVSCILFICAVIPSHIHGFYVSWTYFGRKKKVRRGQYPGNWRRGIYSEKVQYGGASRSEYLRLKAGKSRPETDKLERSYSSRSDHKTKRKVQTWDDGMSEKLGYESSGNGNASHGHNNRTSIYARPQQPSRRNTAGSRRNSNGTYSQVTQGDNIRPSMSHRHSSNNTTRRSVYDRQGVTPPISRTNSGRGRETRPISDYSLESEGDSDAGGISPILQRTLSGARRRLF